MRLIWVEEEEDKAKGVRFCQLHLHRAISRTDVIYVSLMGTLTQILSLQVPPEESSSTLEIVLSWVVSQRWLPAWMAARLPSLSRSSISSTSSRVWPFSWVCPSLSSHSSLGTVGWRPSSSSSVSLLPTCQKVSWLLSLWVATSKFHYFPVFD